MKKLIAILLSMVMCVTCSVVFIGCNKDNKPDSSVETPTDDPATEIPQKVEIEPIDQLLMRNFSDISLLDVKQAEGNIVPLLFKDVTIGKVLKSLLEENTGENPPMILLNLYDDGTWKVGPNANKIDEDLNTILNYELFSGPLGIPEARLEIVGEKKLLDLVCSSFFNVSFSIENTINEIEKKNSSGQSKIANAVSAMGGNPINQLVNVVSENAELFELVKPLLLLSINDIYQFTVDNGATLAATYLQMDIDVFISVAMTIVERNLKGAPVGELTALLCKLVNGTLNQPAIDETVLAYEVIDDVLNMFGGAEANIPCKLLAIFKSYVEPESTIGSVQLKDIKFATVEEAANEVERLLLALGVNQNAIDVVKSLMGKLLVDGSLTLNVELKVSDIIDMLVPTEHAEFAQLAQQAKELFGERTIGNLLAPQALTKAEADQMIDLVAQLFKTLVTNNEIQAKIDSLAETVKSYISESAEGFAELNSEKTIKELILDIGSLVGILPFGSSVNVVIDTLFESYADLFDGYLIGDFDRALMNIEMDKLLNIITLTVRAATNENTTAKLIQLIIDALCGTVNEPQFDSKFTNKTIADIANDYLSESIQNTAIVRAFKDVTVDELVQYVSCKESVKVDTAMNAVSLTDLLAFVSAVRIPQVNEMEAFALIASSTVVVGTTVVVVILAFVDAINQAAHKNAVTSAYTDFLTNNAEKEGVYGNAVLVYTTAIEQTIDTPLQGELLLYNSGSFTKSDMDVKAVLVKDLGEKIEYNEAYRITDTVYIIFIEPVVDVK